MILRAMTVIFLVLSCVGAAPPKLEKLNDDQIGELPQSGEIVLINFWATWCAPCVEELPIFVKLQKESKHLKVVGVSMDELNDEANIHKFLKDNPVNYRIVLWVGNDFEKMVNSIDPEWNGPIPATFIFQKGKRIYSKIGQITEEELRKQIPKSNHR